MDQVLQGIPRVQCILDDMIVTGKDDDEHLATLDVLFQRLHFTGLQLNLAKC